MKLPWNTIGRASPPPAVSQLTPDPAAIPNIALAFIIGLGVVIVIVAYLRIRVISRTAPTDPNQSPLVQIASVIIAGVAAIGAVTRALAVPASTVTPWVPNLDGITLTWLGVAAVGLLVPLLSEVTVGSLTIKIKQVAEQIIDETNAVVRAWTLALGQYLEDAQAVRSAEKSRWPDRLEQFVLWRLSEASEWMGTTSDNISGNIKLAVLLAEEGKNELYFTYTFGFADHVPKTPIGFLNGVAGVAFTENLVRSEIEPSRFPARMFIILGTGTRVGKSLLAVPINFGDRQLGILSVDRARLEYYDDKAIDVMRTLAQVLGIAIGEAERISKL